MLFDENDYPRRETYRQMLARENAEMMHEEEERAALAEAVQEYQDSFEETPGCVAACFADGATQHAHECNKAYLAVLASAGDVDAAETLAFCESIKAYKVTFIPAEASRAEAVAAYAPIAAPVADALNDWLSATTRRAA